MSAALVMITKDGHPRRFALTKPRTVIGRARDCDLRIALRSVSLRHCEIIIDEQHRIIARDLTSAGGTFVNTSQITEIMLQTGDTLDIGPISFTLSFHSEPTDAIKVRTLAPNPEIV